MESCIYLGDEVSGNIHECCRYEQCIPVGEREGIVDCGRCKSKVLVGTIPEPDDWYDPLRVTDRKRTPTDALRGMLWPAPGAAFLVCGGPSLNYLDTSQLGDRGIFSLGVNNVCGHVPASAFVCSDPPSKFHWGIHCDPKIMSFFPSPKLTGRRAKIRRKLPEDKWADCTVCGMTGRVEVTKRGVTKEKKCGECHGLKIRKFETLDLRAHQCPNTWGFTRRGWLKCDDTWFTEPGAAWGNLNDGIKRLGLPESQKTVNTMFLGLRLLQYLGARQIFILGCDFWMDPEAAEGKNYAFNELRWASAVESNNRQYEIANEWLCNLRSVFEKWGFQTYNCNRESRLRAFDYVPFGDALAACRGLVPEESFDLKEWYAK